MLGRESRTLSSLLGLATGLAVSWSSKDLVAHAVNDGKGGAGPHLGKQLEGRSLLTLTEGGQNQKLPGTLYPTALPRRVAPWHPI